MLDSYNKKQPSTSPFPLQISFARLAGVCFSPLIFLGAALKHNLLSNTCSLIEVQPDLLANVSGSIAFVSIRFTKSHFGALACYSEGRLWGGP